jgi:ATP-dependent DNA helicase MPH1
LAANRVAPRQSKRRLAFMSDDDFFDDDMELDEDALKQLDDIEKKAFSPPKKVSPADEVIDLSFDDFTFDVDEEELQKLDKIIENKIQYQMRSHNGAGPSRSGGIQTTLDGGVYAPSTSTLKPRAPIQRNRSSSNQVFGKKPQKVKQWDHTEFAKSGLKRRQKQKDKEKAAHAGDDEFDEMDIEFEQFPAPFISGMASFSLYQRLV